MVSPVFPAAAIASVPAEVGGTAGAAANSSRQLGLALGIAVCGAIFATGTGRGDTGGTQGVVHALVFCGLLALVSGALAAWLPRQPAPVAH
jgi:hypothetical protein